MCVGVGVVGATEENVQTDKSVLAVLKTVLKAAMASAGPGRISCSEMMVVKMICLRLEPRARAEMMVP